MLLVVGHTDVESAETLTELDEVYELISVLVNLFEQVDSVLLEVAVLAARLDLVHDNFVGGLGEDLAVVLHVLFGVLVRGDEHKLEAREVHRAPDHEVALLVVLPRHRVVLLLALHEAPADAARVLVAGLVDQDRVVAAVEAHDEGARLVIRLG